MIKLVSSNIAILDTNSEVEGAEDCVSAPDDAAAKAPLWVNPNPTPTFIPKAIFDTHSYQQLDPSLHRANELLEKVCFFALSYFFDFFLFKL